MAKKRVTTDDIKPDDLKGIQLRQCQLQYYKTIIENEITFSYGPAGTAKTFTSLYTALDLISKSKQSKIYKIILTKPIQESGERLGFLPGEIEDKIGPYMESFRINMYKIIGKENTEWLINNKIEFHPLAYMRGATFDNCLMEGEIIYLKDNSTMKIEDLYDDLLIGKTHEVLSYNIEKNIIESNLLSAIIPSNVIEYIQIELDDGTITNVSPEHKFFTKNGLKEAKDLDENDEIISY